MTGGFLLWHDETPIGCCLFTPPALENSARNKVFDLSGKYKSRTVNQWFEIVQRIVLDPRYRGAGLAADFLKAAAFAQGESRNTRYIEIITSFGGVNHFCQAAGFELMGTTQQIDDTKGTRGGGDRGISRGKSDETKHRTAMRKLHHFILDLETADDPRPGRNYTPSKRHEVTL